MSADFRARLTRATGEAKRRAIANAATPARAIAAAPVAAATSTGQQTDMAVDQVVDAFDALPRAVRIEILLTFSADEVENVFCKLSRRYRRIYCGDMTLADTIGDLEVVYEVWQGLLQRDFGVSPNPDLCRGHTPRERKMVAAAIDRAVPTTNRLNSFKARGYAIIYYRLASLDTRIIPGLSDRDHGTVLGTQDHMVFFETKRRSGDQLVSTANLTTTVDFVYGQLTNETPVRYTLTERTTERNTIGFRIITTKSYGGAYLLFEDDTTLAETGNSKYSARIVHFYKDIIGVSVAFPTDDLGEWFVNLDPLKAEHAHAWIRAPNKAWEHYRMTSTDRLPDEYLLRKECAVEKISEMVPRLSRTFQFDSFALTTTVQSVQFTSNRFRSVTIQLPDSALSFSKAAVAILPLSRLDSDTAVAMRFVLLQKDADRAEILCVECDKGTARPRQATFYRLLHSGGEIPRYEINQSQIFRLAFGPMTTKLHFTLNLDTGQSEAGQSIPAYNFWAGFWVSIYSPSKTLVPLPANAPADLRNIANTPVVTIPLALTDL
jgi:hypothetical protein